MMKLLDIASYSFLISDTDYNKVNQTFRSFLSFLILETDYKKVNQTLLIFPYLGNR